MSIESVILSKDAVEEARESLRAIQKYEQDQRTHGVNRVELYVEDIDGDWLEEWGSEDNDCSSCLSQ